MFKYEYNEIWGKCQWDNNPKVKLYQKCLLRNYKSDSIQTAQECSLDGPLQSLGFLFWYNIQDGSFPIVSNVKLSPAVAAILNFISEQKT
jgi:hypothetical protein